MEGKGMEAWCACVWPGNVCVCPARDLSLIRFGEGCFAQCCAMQFVCSPSCSAMRKGGIGLVRSTEDVTDPEGEAHHVSLENGEWRNVG